MCVTFLFMDTLGCSLIFSQLEFTSEESAPSKRSRKALKKPCKGERRVREGGGGVGDRTH